MNDIINDKHYYSNVVYRWLITIFHLKNNGIMFKFNKHAHIK